MLPRHNYIEPNWNHDMVEMARVWIKVVDGRSRTGFLASICIVQFVSY